MKIYVDNIVCLPTLSLPEAPIKSKVGCETCQSPSGDKPSRESGIERSKQRSPDQNRRRKILISFGIYNLGGVWVQGCKAVIISSAFSHSYPVSSHPPKRPTEILQQIIMTILGNFKILIRISKLYDCLKAIMAKLIRSLRTKMIAF